MPTARELPEALRIYWSRVQLFIVVAVVAALLSVIVGLSGLSAIFIGPLALLLLGGICLTVLLLENSFFLDRKAFSDELRLKTHIDSHADTRPETPLVDGAEASPLESLKVLAARIEGEITSNRERQLLDVVRAGSAGDAFASAFELAFLLALRNENVLARALYASIAESDQYDLAPKAANNLGNLLATTEIDTTLAAMSYRAAIDSGHEDATPTALYNLGALLEKEGHRRGAMDALRRAARSDHPDASPKALVLLGIIMWRRRLPRYAKTYFEEAIATNHKHAAARAMNNLGVVLAAEGDFEGALKSYRAASESGDSGVIRIAQSNINLLIDRHQEQQMQQSIVEPEDATSAVRDLDQ